jgi:hypothetical protein
VNRKLTPATRSGGTCCVSIQLTTLRRLILTGGGSIKVRRSSRGHAPAQEQGHGLLDATQDLPRKIHILQAYLAINHALNSFTAMYILVKKKLGRRKNLEQWRCHITQCAGTGLDPQHHACSEWSPIFMVAGEGRTRNLHCSCITRNVAGKAPHLTQVPRKCNICLLI